MLIIFNKIVKHNYTTQPFFFTTIIQQPVFILLKNAFSELLRRSLEIRSIIRNLVKNHTIKT